MVRLLFTVLIFTSNLSCLGKLCTATLDIHADHPITCMNALSTLQLTNTMSRFDYTLLLPRLTMGYAALYCQIQSSLGLTQLLSRHQTNPHILMSWFIDRLNVSLAAYISSSKLHKQPACLIDSGHCHKSAPTSVLFVRCQPRVETLSNTVQYPQRRTPYLIS